MSSNRSGTIIVALLLAANAFAAQTHYSTVSINSGQVPSTQTDFPVLVSVTDARFKTVGNGGYVADAQGDDIRPYTDTTLGTAITGYEKVFYDGTNGILEMWVKVSSLSSSTTPFVLGYGDTSLTSDGSSTTTWSNSFVSVYHLKDGTTLSVSDSVGNNNGTNSGTTATAGKIDGGNNLTAASSQYVDLGSGSTLNISGNITMSCWVNLASQPTSNSLMVMISKDFTGGNRVSYLFDFFNNSGTQQFRGGCYNGTQHGFQNNLLGTGFTTGAWFLMHATYTGSAWRGYINGSFIVNQADATGPIASTDACKIGNTGNLTRYIDGKMDEVRIASTNRSDDWITTEYNNQNAPGSFYTLGSNTAVGATARGWFHFIP